MPEHSHPAPWARGLRNESGHRIDSHDLHSQGTQGSGQPALAAPEVQYSVRAHARHRIHNDLLFVRVRQVIIHGHNFTPFRLDHCWHHAPVLYTPSVFFLLA
jgi:hypothetical protein